MSALPNASVPEFLAGLIERARAEDGQPPFSDQSLVELLRDERTLCGDERGAAIVSDDELEFVVDPGHRGQGLGSTLLNDVLREHPDVAHAWAHGDHPASRALAHRFEFTPVRTLLQLRAPVTAPTGAADSRLRSFQAGTDDSAWLALNAKAFAHHPEQSKISQHDLDDRKAEPWFDAEDFLLMQEGIAGGTGDLVGFCWLKVEGDLGEIYAIGIDPARQGEGLGRVLMNAGFSRLAERGIRTVALYVEADNEPALALYERYGFTRHTIDVRYQRPIR